MAKLDDVLYYEAVALRDLGDGRWLFQCGNGKKYIENLSVALDKDSFGKVSEGKKFYIEKFIVENASTEV